LRDYQYIISQIKLKKRGVNTMLKNVDNVKLNNAIKTVTDLYNGKKGVVVTANYYTGKYATPMQVFKNMETEFEMVSDGYNVQANGLEQGFDNIPIIRMVSGCSTWTMAFAYGCKMIDCDEKISAQHLIKDIKDVYSLKKPENIASAGVYPIIEERILEFQRRYGNVLISSSDLQSPNDVLTEIMDTEEAIIAMYDEPEAIKHLLSMITESTKEKIYWQKSIINNYSGNKCFAYSPKGIFLADDNAAFLSPSIYEEFDRPYNEILSDEFGGVGLHCCMKFEQNIQLMADTKGFMDFDPQTDFNSIDIISKSLKGKNAIHQLNNAPFQKNLHREYSDEIMLKNAIDEMIEHSSIYCSVYGDTPDQAFDLAYKIKDYVAKKGY
jgi:hypothetical protein